MENKNMPELQNPMISMIQGNMPGLPDIIRNAMPVELPRPSYNQNPFSLWYTDYKIGKLEKIQEKAANIAEASLRTVKAKLDAIHELMTCSARMAESLGVYEHAKALRALQLQLLQVEINMKNGQAQQLYYEAKLSELDFNIKQKQYNQMMKEEPNGTATA